jgi:site-specific DNA-methyltransferase (adenine-specific)
MPKPIAHLLKGISNTLFYGDNLPILREYIPDESVDLVYLDPPFNSQRVYNVSLRDETGQEAQAQIEAFKDFWRWDETAQAFDELRETAPASVVTLMAALREIVGETPLLAYLTMMTARLLELRRALKPTGSLYLHCDPTASHYLKIVLDTIFGQENFRNEIIWKRTSAHSSANRYGPVHDVLFYYTKSENYLWNKSYTPHDKEYVEKFYRHVDENGRKYTLSDLTAVGTRNGSSGQAWRGIDVAKTGRHWKTTIDSLEKLDTEGRIYWPAGGGMPRYKRYLDEVPGIAIQDVITDISLLLSQAINGVLIKT